MYQTMAKESFDIECHLQIPSTARSIEIGDETIIEAFQRLLQQKLLCLSQSDASWRQVYFDPSPIPLTQFKTVSSPFDTLYNLSPSNETVLTEAEIPFHFHENIEYDVFVHMPPVRHYTVKVKIKSVQAGIPKTVDPDMFID